MATKRTPETDAEKIAELEAEGMTHSDAVGVLMAEEMIAEQEAEKRATRRLGQRRTPAEKVADGKAANRAPCLCGCGGTPKGPKARFLPGHDARYHSALKKAAISGQ